MLGHIDTVGRKDVLPLRNEIWTHVEFSNRAGKSDPFQDQKLRGAHVLVASRQFQCPVLEKKVFIVKYLEKFISFQSVMWGSSLITYCE